MSDWHASLFTGLFTRFGPMTPRPHDPDCALSSGTVASSPALHGTATASGIGWDPAAAADACLGEAIERLQCAPTPDDQLVTARFADWRRDEPALAPERSVLFHAEQYRQSGFPFRPLTCDSECAWVAFRQACTGGPMWVPADLAYLHLPGGHRACPGYSTGLAAGRIGDPVLLRGLQEAIERDAVIGAWWGRYRIFEHDHATAFDQLGASTRNRVVRPNLTYRFFRIDSPFSAHATMVTLEGEDREGYCFSIGSSCRETRRESWLKSLLEAIHGRHYVRYLKMQVASGAMAMGRSPASFAEHAVYYSLNPGALRSTVLAAKPTGEGSEPAASEPTAALIERLGPRHPVLFRSMTPPALASEGLGWQVLRVIVPGLQPMHGDHALPHLGGPLWAPRGLADWRDMPPHPFP